MLSTYLIGAGTALAVVIRLIKDTNWEPAKKLKGVKVQLLVAGVSLAVVVGINLYEKSLSLDNLPVMVQQIGIMISMNVFFYEYILKNLKKILEK